MTKGFRFTFDVLDPETNFAAVVPAESKRLGDGSVEWWARRFFSGEVIPQLALSQYDADGRIVSSVSLLNARVRSAAVNPDAENEPENIALASTLPPSAIPKLSSDDMSELQWWRNEIAPRFTEGHLPKPGASVAATRFYSSILTPPRPDFAPKPTPVPGIIPIANTSEPPRYPSGYNLAAIREVNIESTDTPHNAVTLDEVRKEPNKKKSGQYSVYVSEEERKRGFVEPVRRSYIHVGTTRLPGCNTATTMNLKIAETFAREPEYYTNTFCAECNTQRPAGEDGEFVWVDAPSQRVGTRTKKT